MGTVNILGAAVTVSFADGQDISDEMKATLRYGIDQMADLINSRVWTTAYADAFRIMRKIIFFDQPVIVNTWLLDRPGCDEDDAHFYWEIEEFLRNTDADVRANTYFHDCWHVVQYRRAGNRFARDEQERVDREVDAIDQQIAVASLIGCSQPEIEFLRDFRDDQGVIIARLKEGIEPGGRMRHEGNASLLAQARTAPGPVVGSG
ncbi:MAG: hypothetical protein ABW184_17840 [Sphingobium sp.]